MNKFTQLRNDSFEKDNQQPFPALFLEKYEEENPFEKKEETIVNDFKIILQLHAKKDITETDIIGVFSYLGQNDYLDRYIENTIIENCHVLTKGGFDEKVLCFLSKSNKKQSTIVVLIDSLIECNRNALSKETIVDILKDYRKQATIFSIVIDYLYHFKVDGFKQDIYDWLKEDYPINIKIQLIDLLVELYSLESLNQATVEGLLPFQKNKRLSSDYMSILKKEKVVQSAGLTILQSMFYGDFENSGKGNNGGMAVFLKTLGNELSKSDKVSLVVTLTITNEWADNQSIMNYYSDNHLFIRVPIFIDATNKDPFLNKERFIKRTIKRFLENIGVEPDIFHVRYLDNASKAIALLSKELGKKLVLTLTPDPHRNMVNQDGTLKYNSFDESFQKLNKMIIGDELIFASDQIVGIGNHKVKKELELYFPQLIKEEKKETIWMISEGIQSDSAVENRNGEINLSKELRQVQFKKRFFDKPIILNVGRLDRMKAQDELVKAWGNSSLSDVYNLLVIGGDIEKPSKDEKKMMNSFEEYFAKHPHLKNNFHHIGALSNKNIRLIEKKLWNNKKLIRKFIFVLVKKKNLE